MLNPILALMIPLIYEQNNLRNKIRYMEQQNYNNSKVNALNNNTMPPKQFDIFGNMSVEDRLKFFKEVLSYVNNGDKILNMLNSFDSIRQNIENLNPSNVEAQEQGSIDKIKKLLQSLNN